MKKFTALILTLISVLFLFTSCKAQPLVLDGKYYQSSLGPSTNVNETCVYDVSVVSNTPYKLTEYKNANVQYVIDQGTLTTTLTVLQGEDKQIYGDGYLYTSTLQTQGKYVIDGVEHPVQDEVITKTWFKDFIRSFAPCKTEKYINNNTLVYTDKYEVANYEFNYTVTYGDKATVNTTIIKDDFNHLTSLNGTLEYANYLNGAFVENEIILFTARTFNLTEDYYQAFNTLDVVSKKLQPMKYYTITSNGNLLIKNINLPTYTYNGITETNKKVDAAMLSIELNDVFSGSPIEAYYATNHSEMRHLLVEYYTKLNSNLGYLKYTLKEVTFSD